MDLRLLYLHLKHLNYGSVIALYECLNGEKSTTATNLPFTILIISHVIGSAGSDRIENAELASHYL